MLECAYLLKNLAVQVVCRQPSSRSNSLLTGKLTGNFSNFAEETPLQVRLSYRIHGSCRHAHRYYCQTEQGIVATVSGNYHFGIREFYFPVTAIMANETFPLVDLKLKRHPL
jgi:hypothetical protein